MKRYNSTETTAESRKRLNRIVPDITSVLLSIFPSKRDAKLDDARMQALFNALALLFLLVGACIAAAVYYVLQPFLHALLWAILTGTFLHPFKHRCTTQLNAWLLNLEDSNVPLTFGLLLSPLYLFNWASTSLKDLALTHWRALAGSVLGLGGLWVLVAISASAYDGLEVAYGAMTQMDAMLAQTRWLQVCYPTRTHTHTHTRARTHTQHTRTHTHTTHAHAHTHMHGVVPFNGVRAYGKTVIALPFVGKVVIPTLPCRNHALTRRFRIVIITMVVCSIFIARTRTR